jgi:hypothetical protein
VMRFRVRVGDGDGTVCSMSSSFKSELIRIAE